jgi:hypothetical protein
MAVSLVSTGVTFPDNSTQTTAATGFGFKNRIINGAMVISQRNGTSSVSCDGNVYGLDRWKYVVSQTGKMTVQQNAGSVTPPVGFSNYMGFTSSSAYSVGTTEYFWVEQPIEGFNIADLNWGTANAATVTLSFRVYSSLTGTFGGALQNSASNRSYPFSYSVPTANTWTTISVTIAGDTSGTWLTTNGVGINVIFGLGVGLTSLNGTAGAWVGSQKSSVTGAVSVVGTNGATFYITGVQLEKGSTATSFDYRPYGTELQLAQRYFYQHAKGNNVVFGFGSNYSVAYMTSYVQFPVTMRATPTLVLTTGTDFYAFYRNNAGDFFNSLAFGGSPQGGELYNSTEISGTAGQAGFLTTSNGSSSIAFQIEL